MMIQTPTLFTFFSVVNNQWSKQPPTLFKPQQTTSKQKLRLFVSSEPKLPAFVPLKTVGVPAACVSHKHLVQNT